MKLTTVKALYSSTILVIAAIIFSVLTYLVHSAYQIFLVVLLLVLLFFALGLIQIAKSGVTTKTGELQKPSSVYHEKFIKAFHDNVAALAIGDENGRYIDVNRAFLSLVEFSRDEFLGKTAAEIGFLTVEDKLELTNKLKKKGAVINNELQLKTRSGQLKTVLASLTNIEINQQLERLTTFIDITEKKQAEEELKRANEELHHLSSHLENVREEERINIAREIHDELGQQLTGLKMDIHWLNKRLSDQEIVVRTRLTDALELVNETIVSVNKISSNLRPSILDDLGLIAAIEWQSGEVYKRSQIHVNFVSAIQEVEIPESIKTGMFRIYQEALTNAVRHSNATEINSSLHFEENCITLEVKDNGHGFNKESLHKKTFGLLGIKERTYAMRGKYELKSEPGQGTTIWICVPLL